MLKKVLGIILSIAMLIGTLPAVSFAAAAEVTGVALVNGDMTTVNCYKSGRYETEGLITETDASSPVEQYIWHKNLSDLGETGIRHGTNGQFQVTEGEYILASYWVKAEVEEGTESAPTVYGYTQYTNNKDSGSTILKDVNASGYIELSSGKWYKRYQIFSIPTTTIGGTSGENTSLRFLLATGKVLGQKTYLGDLEIYSFASDFAYGGLTGTDAIAAYVEDVDLSAAYKDGEAIEGFDPDVLSYSLIYAGASSITADADSIFADVSYDASEEGVLKITTTSYPYNGGAPVEYTSESALTKTYTFNQLAVAENILSDSYTLEKWTGGGVSYIANSKPSLVEDGGAPAMMYDANDSAYAEGTTSSWFRAQLSGDYFEGERDWVAGDRIYVSFMARAESRYANATTASIHLNKVSSAANSSQGSMSTTAKFTLNGAWKKYFAIIEISGELEDENYVRFRIDCGYMGQTTYIRDFEAYFCNGENDEVIGYLQNNDVVNMVKNSVLGLSGAGSGDTQRGTVETITEFTEETPVNFSAAYKFTSTDYTNTNNTNNSTGYYKARLFASNTYSQTASAGDKVLLTYWAKGEYTGSTDGETAWMQPQLQASVNGSGGKFIECMSSDGSVAVQNISVGGEWKRYAHIFEIPVSDGYDMQVNWYIGKINQNITYADVQLYNLGPVTVDEAYAYLDDTDAQLFYRTKPMTLAADGSYIAFEAESAPELTEADIAAIGTNDFTSYNVDTLPVIGGEAGAVTLIAPDGTQKTVTVKMYETLTKAINAADTAEKVSEVLATYSEAGYVDLSAVGTLGTAELCTLLAAKSDFASNAEVQAYIDEYVLPYTKAELISLDITYTLDNSLYCGYGDITISDLVAAAKVTDAATVKAYEYDGITEADTSKLAHEGIKLIVTAANGITKAEYCLGYAKYAEFAPLAGFGTDDEGAETFSASFTVKSYVAEEKSYYVIAAEYSGNALVGCDVKKLTVNAADTFTAEAVLKTTDSASNTFKAMVFEAGSIKPVKKSVEINKSLAGANVLSFGDSITGSYEPGYPGHISNLLGTVNYNGGIGGTTLSYASSGSAQYTSMVKISEFISNPDYDFTDTDAYVEANNNGPSKVHYTDVLKTVDVADMDYITMLFGTNDYTNDRLLDNANDKYDVTTIKGAARYVFENLFAKNPDVKIIVAAPFYRDRWKWDAEGNEDARNSDETPNGAGLYVSDYSNAIVEVCAEYGIDAYNLYEISDINRFNEFYYLSDGLHPTEAGMQHLGGLFAQMILSK